MMSFYGQVVYEFTKMFSKFMVKESLPSTHINYETPITPPSAPADHFFEAKDMWEQINIAPSNRWIQLDGTGGVADTKTIHIGHGTPGAQQKTEAISLEKITSDEVPEGRTAIDLQNGDYLKVTGTRYDNAGHLMDNMPLYDYYRLPVATINIGGGASEDDVEPSPTSDKILFKDDGHWIKLTKENDAETNENYLKFAHAILDKEDLTEEQYTDFITFQRLHHTDTQLNNIEAYLAAMSEIDKKNTEEVAKMRTYLNELSDTENISNIHVLQSGDLIKTYQTTEDEQGHLIATEPIYYKLPVSATDSQFEDHKERIQNIEDRLASGTINRSSSGKPNIEYDAYEKVVQKVYEDSEFAGVISHMFMDPSLASGASMANIIGIVDTYQDPEKGPVGIRPVINGIAKGDEVKSWYTVSDAIQILVRELKEKSEAIITANEAIAYLKVRVDALEEKLKETTE